MLKNVCKQYERERVEEMHLSLCNKSREGIWCIINLETIGEMQDVVEMMKKYVRGTKIVKKKVTS